MKWESAACLLAAAQAFAQPCQPAWSNAFGAKDLGAGGGSIESAAVVDDDGAGPHAAELYVAGTFNSIGGVAISNVGKWNGSTWTSVPLGLTNVRNLVAFDEDGPGPLPTALYGIGKNGSNIYPFKWNGSSITLYAAPLFGSFYPTLEKLLVLDEDGPGPGLARLFAIVFTQQVSPAGVHGAGSLYRLDPIGWTEVLFDTAVASAAWWDPDGAGPQTGSIYASSYNYMFSSSVLVTDYQFQLWRLSNPTSQVWSISSTDDFHSYNIAAFDDDGAGPQSPSLYVAGRFPLGGPTTDHLAKWNGTALVPVPGDVTGPLKQLITFDSDPLNPASPAMYGLGTFSTVGGTSARGIARWNGAAWSALGPGIAANINTLIAHDDDASGPRPRQLFALGDFAQAGYAGIRGIARWDGQFWIPPGNIVSDSCRALVTADLGSGAALYVGGTFSDVGGLQVGSFAKWDGSRWSAFGPGFNNQVYALAAYNSGTPGLIAAGKFTSLGASTPASHIAIWRQGQWAELPGGGTNGDIHALAVQPRPALPPLLYAGGSFSSAGTATTAGNFAVWNGTQWQALGSFNADVDAIAIVNGQVFAGGKFTSIVNTDGSVTSASRVAWFDGQHWNAAGLGVNGAVNSMTAFDDGTGAAMYIGGAFSLSGGAAVSGIAKWNGAEWSGVGGGISGGGSAVHSLHVARIGARDSLIAGGSFNAAGGNVASNIAYWDGTAWRGIESGTDGPVRSLTTFDIDGTGPNPLQLILGGDFLNAGGTSSWHLAARTICSPTSCYANCDGSIASPILNINDFLCFVNKFAAGESYANCDNSSAAPVLNVNDFSCFLNSFAAGCT